MPPAARITDMHTCPMVNPGPVPHVGGPEVSGSPDVITGFQPQGRVGDTLVCVPATDKVAMGSPTVLVNNKMAARLGDPTVHGGVLVSGCPTVIIGQSGQGATLAGAAKTGTPFCEECEKAKKAAAAAEQKEAPAANAPPADAIEAITDKGKQIIESVKRAIDEVLPPEKRKEIEHLIKTIKPVAQQALARGDGEQSVAKWAVAARKAIAEHYGAEIESNGDLVAFVYQRNKEKFGDALGPQVEWLMSEKGKNARDLIDAGANGNFKEKLGEMKGDLVDQLSEQVIDDPRARQLIRAATEGKLEEKVRELGGDIASDAVKDFTGSETAGALAKAAATNTLSDKLGELSGEVVDKAVGKLISSEETRSLLGPIIDHVKGQVSEKVIEKATALLGGGA
jgi:uncharacterized Zn-binding protein involved in type VI secretion